ncbi:MAG: signal transduction histidine kinase [Maribacter sp.]
MNYQTDLLKKLKKVEAFLPHKPVSCLRELVCLKESFKIRTGDEEAMSYLIEGRAYLELDNRDQALECFVKGLEIDGISEMNATPLKMNKAFLLCSRNQVQEARKILKGVITDFEKQGEDELCTEAKMYYGLTHLRNSEYSESLKLFLACYEYATLKKYSILEVKLSSYMFTVHFLVDNMDEASDWLEKSIELNKEVGLMREEVTFLIKKGNLSVNQKKYQQSIQEFQKALQIIDEIEGDHKIQRLVTLINLADVFSIPEVVDLIVSYEIYLEVMELVEDTQHYNALSHTLLGITTVLLKKDESKIPFSPLLDESWMEAKLKQAADILEKDNLILNRVVLQAYSNYYRYKGDFEKAVMYMDKLMEYNEKLLRKEKADSVDILQIKNKLQQKELEFKNLELKQKKELEKINKSLENKINTRTQRLKIKNKELKEYAYIVAHDLKEPIRSIVGFSQILSKRMKDYASPSDLELFEFIKNSGNHMNELVEDLLKYSILNLDEEELVITDFNKLLTIVLASLHFSIESSESIIEIQELPKNIYANGLMMKQVFQNLISNAIKFKKDNKQSIIKIACEIENDNYLFSVSDNGIGIGDEYHEIIFKLFNRLHKNKGYEGTGIGLAISKKIIEQHNGKIWLESKVGEGATFYFTLPK